MGMQTQTFVVRTREPRAVARVRVVGVTLARQPAPLSSWRNGSSVAHVTAQAPLSSWRNGSSVAHVTAQTWSVAVAVRSALRCSLARVPRQSVLLSEWRRKSAGDTSTELPGDRIPPKPTEGAEAFRVSGGGGSTGQGGPVAVGEPLPHAGVGGRTGGVDVVQHDEMPRCGGGAVGAAAGASAGASKRGLLQERWLGSGKISSGDVGTVCRLGTLDRRRDMPG